MELFIRRETHEHEYRAPLVPRDVKRLVELGYSVYVESSPHRIYKDSEYTEAGAILTLERWHAPPYVNCLILGIKELTALEHLRAHRHAYFSHSFKGQNGSEEILRAFHRSGSKLYDFEFFTTPHGKRLISFGWYAGVVGAILGLQPSLGPLAFWPSMEDLLTSVPKSSTAQKIAVVGSRGRCGSGVCDTLDTLQIPYAQFGKEDSLDTLHEYDIIYNCILLDAAYTKRWFTERPSHPITIVDISCDYSKPNNPIPFYKEATTWDTPIFYAEPNLRIIAIENLPSLLPKESSDHFSSILTELLVQTADVWDRALGAFQAAVKLNAA